MEGGEILQMNTVNLKIFPSHGGRLFKINPN